MKKALFFVLLAFFPTTIFAATPYITFNLMGSYPEETKTNIGSTLEYQVGIGGTTSVGFATEGDGTTFRGDIEVGYRNNKMSRIKYGGETFTLSGRVDLWSFMTNGFVDFPIFNQSKLTLGAGVGMADVRFKPKYGGSTSDTVFAYQGMIGWSIPVSEYDFLDIQYRYLGVSDIKHENVNFSYGLHGIMIGFRMAL